ncbi:MAG: hypothetical protein ACK5F5_00605 [Gammaproteobacteria bacterium]|jgi:hypothetical protein
MAKDVRLSDDWALTLGALFGDEAVRGVEVRERVWWLKPMPWVAAITGPSRIWLRGQAEEFFADPEFVLHEYYHVLNQWDTRRLSIFRYLREWLRVGYRRNAFEVEARNFAAREVGRCRQLLAAARRPAPEQHGA